MKQAPSAFTLIVFILFLISTASTLYFYRQYQEIKLDPQKATQEETAKLVEQVAKVIVVPADETPTVATVTDPEQLKDQPFFTNAKVGDKVLIYSKAKKAILYDPVNNKIVEVAPVNLGNPETQINQESPPQQ